MKTKKLLTSLVLVGVMTIGSTMGTYAKYAKSVQSGNNDIKAANFIIKGSNIADQAADVTLDKFAPGDSGAFNFTVVNNDATRRSEVPMQYNVSLTRTNQIGNLKLSLWKSPEGTEANPGQIYTYEKVGDFTLNESYQFNFNANVNELDRYQLRWNWEENDATDVSYEGLTERLVVHVNAQQVVENSQYVKVWIGPLAGITTVSTIQERTKMTTTTNASGQTIYKLFNVGSLGNIEINAATAQVTINNQAHNGASNVDRDFSDGRVHFEGTGSGRLQLTVWK